MRYLHLYEQGLGCQAKAKREGREKYTRKPVRIDLSLRYAIVSIIFGEGDGLRGEKTPEFSSDGSRGRVF